MNDFQPDPFFTIEDAETLRVVADPLRIQLLELMATQAFTAKQVADRLGLTPSKLYYHINTLEKHGLLTLVETRMVANLQEKYFRATAYSFQVAESLLNLVPDGGIDPISTLVSSTLDTTKEDILRSFQAKKFVIDEEAKPKEKRAMISRMIANLPEAQIDPFFDKLQTLCQEFNALDESDSTEESMRWALAVAFYPTIYFPEEE